MSEIMDRAALAACVAVGCGCQVGDERVLCDDPRVAHHDHPNPCDCRAAASATILALADGVTDEMVEAFKANLEPYTDMSGFEAEAALGWQLIESAPKDYDKHGLTRRILLAAPPVNASGWMIAEGFWRVAASNSRYRTGWVTCMDPNVESPYFEPTHWAPLPSPPNLATLSPTRQQAAQREG